MGQTAIGSPSADTSQPESSAQPESSVHEHSSPPAASRYPLLPVALLFAAGILVSSWLPTPPFVLLAVSFAVLVATLALGHQRTPLLCSLILLTGWADHAFHTAILSPSDLRALLGSRFQIATLRGKLRETPSLRWYQLGQKESWRTVAQLEVTALRLHHQTWQPATGQIVVSTPGPLTNLFAGQTVEVTGVAGLPKGADAEGTFDYRAYLRQCGIYYQLQAGSEQDWQLLASPPRPPRADRLRDWGRQALARGLPVEDESLRLEWALALGWKPALTEEVSEPFVRASTYHIFAVDGLRIGIVFGILFGLLRVLGLPRALAGLLAAPLIWFYAALTGWPASAIRADVMLTVVILGWVLKRPGNLLNSLFAAALIILAWQPQQLFLAGFQLSFFVVLCIIVILPPLREFTHRLFAGDPLLPDELRRPWPPFVIVPARFVLDVTLVSFAAWLGSLPLAAYYFNVLTPISTPANLVAVPLCALVLISNFASLLLAGWLPPLAELFNHAGWFLMECIRVSSHWFANWPKAYAYVSAPSLFTIAVYYVVLLSVATRWLFRPPPCAGPTSSQPARKLPRSPPLAISMLSNLFRTSDFGFRVFYHAHPRSWKFAGLAVLLFCWFGYECHEATAMRLTVLPAGGGDALYFDAPGSHHDLLVDCGTTNTVERMLKPFLRAQGVNRLPALLLTHGDLHHVGGAEMVTGLFPTRRVCVSPIRFRSTTYRRTLADFTNSPGLLQFIARNDSVGPWTVLHPEPTDRFSQADDNALVLYANLRGTRVLLLSDLGHPGQNALLERFPGLRADIIITGLPTRTEAVSDALLDTLQPSLVVVSDAEFPVIERASPQLHERLARRHLPVLYTRDTGAVSLEFGDNSWYLRAMNGLALTYCRGVLRTNAIPETETPSPTEDPALQPGASE